VQVQALPRNANGKVLRAELVRLVQSLEAPASGPH
jgi:acyl-coenzyme A synthetase/AMP-(fatty) acid ligase